MPPKRLTHRCLGSGPTLNLSHACTMVETIGTHRSLAGRLRGVFRTSALMPRSAPVSREAQNRRHPPIVGSSVPELEHRTIRLIYACARSAPYGVTFTDSGLADETRLCIFRCSVWAAHSRQSKT